MKNMKNEFNVESSSKAFLWSMFLPQVLSLVLIIILSMFFSGPEEMQASMGYIIPMMIVSQASFAIIYFFSCKKQKISVLSNIKKSTKNLSIKNILICILISVIAIAGLVHFVGIFDGLFEKIGYSAGESLIPNNNFAWFLLNVLISCILPAVLEEAVFRGVIFKGLRNRGFWLAASISAVMFMLVHLSLGSIVYPLIMGLVFAFVVEKTGNVMYSVIIHFCNNFVIKLIDYVNNVSGLNFGEITKASPWHYVIIVVGAVLAVVLIWVLIRFVLNGKQVDNCKAEENQNQETSKENKEQELANVFAKRRENIYLWGSLLIGFAFWLIIIISGLLK